MADWTTWPDALEQVLLRDQDRLRATGLDRVDRFSYATYLERVREVLGLRPDSGDEPAPVPPEAG